MKCFEALNFLCSDHLLCGIDYILRWEEQVAKGLISGGDSLLRVGLEESGSPESVPKPRAFYGSGAVVSKI